MEVISIEAPNAVNFAVNFLDEAGIVMHPTETCYGFAVDVFNESALDKLYHVKNMPKDKPLSILVDSLKMAQEYAEFSDEALKLAKKFWPGALSILLPRKAALPEFFNKGHDLVSVRFSSNEFSTSMVRQFSQPVVTTSANKAGRLPLYIAKKLPGIDVLVNAGKLDFNKPSTIVQFEGGKLKVLRQGDVEV